MTNGEKLQSIFPNMEAEYKEPNKSENPTDSTTKNNLAQERYQDLIDHFGDETVAKTILESRKEFKAWLERIRWTVKRADELARELEQIKSTTKNDCETCIHNKGVLECDMYGCKYEPTTKNDLSSELEKNSKKLEKGTTKNDLGVEKIIDELEKEFEKVNIPIMDKLALFAKTQNALYRCADMREVVEE